MIVRALAGSGFASRAVALTLAAELAEPRSACPPALRAAIEERLRRAEPDAAPPYAHPFNQQPLPADAAALAAHLVPALIAHPSSPGVQLSALWALLRLWPHAAADERARLRTAFLNSCCHLRCPDEAKLTTLQLRQWQKDIPTQMGMEPPSLGALREALDQPQAFAAYLRFVEHLGLQPDLEALCWALGSLAAVQLSEWHDEGGELAALLFATTAIERLLPALSVDAAIILLTQLFHRLWWLRHRGGLRAIRRSLDGSLRPFAAAVASGDCTLAQRAARALVSQHPEGFWPACWPVLASWLPEGADDLGRLLLVLAALRWRTGEEALGHDDAAALATLLAELAWSQQQRRAPCIAAS